VVSTHNSPCAMLVDGAEVPVWIAFTAASTEGNEFFRTFFISKNLQTDSLNLPRSCDPLVITNKMRLYLHPRGMPCASESLDSYSFRIVVTRSPNGASLGIVHEGCSPNSHGFIYQSPGRAAFYIRPLTEMVVALTYIITRCWIGIYQVIEVCARFKCHIVFLWPPMGCLLLS